MAVMPCSHVQAIPSHTAFGDIFYSESPDMEFWGHHRHVMAPARFEESAWQCMKIG